MGNNWIDILDEFERRLDLAESALDNDEPLPIEPFDPPQDIAPLPAALEKRALHVLQRQTDLEQRVETLKAAISREIGVATRAPRASSTFEEASTPSFFDSKV